MKRLTLQKIAEITGGEYIGSANALGGIIAGAVRDDRDVKPGNLFVCISGARADGHSFANRAFGAGAVCCLAEQPIPEAKGPYILVPSTLEAIRKIGGRYRSLFDIPVIGITGSVGKTTTKEMIAAALGAKFNVLKTPENMNNELGVPLTLLSLGEAHGAAVIEMGISDFGEMGRLAEMVVPNIAVITKIGYSHLESLGSLDGVLRAKSEVFNYMEPVCAAVLNGDDELLRGCDPGMRKITFGFDQSNDFRAENVVVRGVREVGFDIVSDMNRFRANVPAYGRHLVPAALSAAAVGRLLGLTDEEIARGLLSYSPVGGRAKAIDTGFITLIDDCYNANPNSVMEALSSLSALPGRHVAILGDMLELGSSSEQLHREIGSFAARNGIGRLVCCGELAMCILEGYVSDGGEGAYSYISKTELIAALPQLIEKGDAVLVKASHGMKFEELLPHLADLPGISRATSDCVPPTQLSFPDS